MIEAQNTDIPNIIETEIVYIYIYGEKKGTKRKRSSV